MLTPNRFVNVAGRCSTLWFSTRLEGTGLEPCDQPYIFFLCRHPRCTQDELSRMLFVNKSSVTRRLARLERLGYVTRTQDPEDKRALLVEPTDKAIEVRQQLHTLAKEWNAQLTAGFSEEEMNQFTALLERALCNAKACTEELAE